MTPAETTPEGFSPRATIALVSSFEERAKARATWPIRRYPVGQEPADADRVGGTVDQRIAMVAELTRQQWALAGRQWPSYRRANAPGRIIRRTR